MLQIKDLTPAMEIFDISREHKKEEIIRIMCNELYLDWKPLASVF